MWEKAPGQGSSREEGVGGGKGVYVGDIWKEEHPGCTGGWKWGQHAVGIMEALEATLRSYRVR